MVARATEPRLLRMQNILRLVSNNIMHLLGRYIYNSSIWCDGAIKNHRLPSHCLAGNLITSRARGQSSKTTTSQWVSLVDIYVYLMRNVHRAL